MATKDIFSDVRAPSALQKIVTLRIERLGDDSRGVLHRAAIIGTVFGYKLLVELMGPVKSGLLDSSLKELEKLDFIFEKSKFPRKTYQFRTPALRDAVYDSIPPQKKIRVHGEIAVYLERLFDKEPEAPVVLIAHHYLQSEYADKAIAFSVKAGEFLVKSYSLREALEYLLKAYYLMCSEPEKREYRNFKKTIYRLKYQIYLLLGKHELAVNSLNSMKALLEPDSYEELLDVRRMLAEILAEKGEFEKASVILKELAEVCRNRPFGSLRVKVLRTLAFIHAFREEIYLTRKVCEEGLFFCTEETEVERGHFFTYLGLTEYCQNEYVKALAYFNKALDVFRTVDDKALTGKAYCNIGMVFFKRGEYENALSNYRLSLYILENIEYQRAVAITRMNLAVLYDHTGEYRKALEEYSRVLKDAEELANPRITMMVLCNLGEVHARLFNLKTAVRHLRDAHAFAKQIGSGFWKVTTLLYLGSCYLEMKNPQGARSALLEALKQATELGEKGKELEIRLELLRVDADKEGNLKALKALIEEIIERKDVGISENLHLKATLNLSEMQFSMGMLEEAIKEVKNAIGIADRLKNKEYLFFFVSLMASILDFDGNEKGTREVLKRGNIILAEILSKIPDTLIGTYTKKTFVAEFLRLLQANKIKQKFLIGDNENEIKQKEI